MFSEVILSMAIMRDVRRRWGETVVRIAAFQAYIAAGSSVVLYGIWFMLRSSASLCQSLVDRPSLCQRLSLSLSLSLSLNRSLRHMHRLSF